MQRILTLCAASAAVVGLLAGTTSAQQFLPELETLFPYDTDQPLAAFDLDRDGARLAVGTPGGSDDGLVRILERATDGTWTEVSDLDGEAVSSALGFELFDFGWSVALDGDVLAVGAPAVQASGQSSSPLKGGTVVVFQRDTSGSWELVDVLSGAQRDNASARFGVALDLSGNTLAVGAPGETTSGIGTHGAGYRFSSTPTGLWLLAERTVGTEPGSYGEAVAVGEQYLAISDPTNDRVDTWRKFANAWNPYATTFGTPPQTFAGNQGRFGASLEIEGAYLAVGTQGEILPAISGAVEVFAAQGFSNVWEREAILLPQEPDEVPYLFGSDVVFSGGRLAVDAPRAQVGPSGAPFSGLGLRLYDRGASGEWTSSARYVSEDVVSTLHHGPAFAQGELTMIQGTGSDKKLVDFDAGDFVRDTGAVSLASGGGQGMFLFAGPERAGDLHLVVGSASGTAPGIAIGGFELPLVSDAWTAFTATGAPPLLGGVGLLDDAGRGSASLAVSPGTNPALAGLKLWHAYLTLDLTAEAITGTSSALEVELVE